MTEMNIRSMLADYAVVADGKLTIVGGGWSIISPNPTPTALALLVKVPWDRTNEKHRVTVRLVDEDGRAFVPDGAPEGFEGIRHEWPVEVGRAPGLRPGTCIDCPLALNIGPLQFVPGKRYEWMVELNDQTNDEWNLPFTVADLPSGQMRLAG
jgi:hypothetical protein